jgi:hypothetical protein
MNNFNLYYKIFELGIDDTMRQDTTAHGVGIDDTMRQDTTAHGVKQQADNGNNNNVVLSLLCTRKMS